MPRYERNTAVLLKNEAVYGTDALPTGAADAMLVKNFKCKPIDGKYINRDLLRPFFGGSEDVLSESWVSGSFDVEIAGSGAAGSAPLWGRILKCAGFAETLFALDRVEYLPVSTALGSGSLYYHDDGVLKKALGMRCDITSLKLGYGELPMASVNFLALDGGDTAAANPAVDLTPWQKPVPINTANSGLLTFGATYAAGALTGGATFKSRGLELALGNQIGYLGLLGGEEIDLTNRDVSGKVLLSLTAAEEVAKIAEIKATATQSVALRHGTQAGGKLLVFMPEVQLKNLGKEALNGRRMIGFDLKALPTTAGNDELLIVAL